MDTKNVLVGLLSAVLGYVLKHVLGSGTDSKDDGE